MHQKEDQSDQANKQKGLQIGKPIDPRESETSICSGVHSDTEAHNLALIYIKSLYTKIWLNFSSKRSYCKVARDAEIF